MATKRGSTSEPVKRALYALSGRRCYAPDCEQPVVIVDGGEPVFVGEIAHIVGAVESGPRGDVEIADRDAFENLLLLCGRHHKVIDNARTRDRYPVEVLREWKAAREGDLDAASRAELQRMSDLAARLPDLIVEAFRETTADLSATVTRLEEAGQLAHETAQLLLAALARTSAPGPAVGDGLPGVKEAFEEAYDAAGGASFLGLPSAEAYELGPGFVQHLRGARYGHPAVICAISDQPAVIVTSELWNAISHVGDRAPGGGVRGVGFPISTAGGDHQYIGPDIDRVPTAGGSWGAGAMIRDADAGWRWVPDVAFEFAGGRDAEGNIDSQQRLDLRLRFAAKMPLPPGELRTTSAGRRLLGAALAKPEMTALVAALAAERTIVPADLAWRPKEDSYGRNDSWGASYECMIRAADGRPGIYGSVQYLMPMSQVSDSPLSLIDVRIDFDSCQAEPCVPNTPVGKPVSLAEIVEFFTSAWSIAFDVMPLALDERSDRVDPGGRPRVSLYIINERPHHSGDERTFDLYDLVDLSPFGITRKRQMHRLDIAVLGRGSLPEHDARDIVRAALIRVADDAGFDATDLVTW